MTTGDRRYSNSTPFCARSSLCQATFFHKLVLGKIRLAFVVICVPRDEVNCDIFLPRMSTDRFDVVTLCRASLFALVPTLCVGTLSLAAPRRGKRCVVLATQSVARIAFPRGAWERALVSAQILAKAASFRTLPRRRSMDSATNRLSRVVGHRRRANADWGVNAHHGHRSRYV